MTVLERIEVRQHEQQRKNNHDGTEGAANAVFGKAFGRINSKIERGAESENVICHADHGWHVEGSDGDGKYPNNYRNERRPHEWEFDAQQSAQPADSMDIGCLHQSWIHTAQGRRYHRESNRSQRNPFDKADAG